MHYPRMHRYEQLAKPTTLLSRRLSLQIAARPPLTKIAPSTSYSTFGWSIRRVSRTAATSQKDIIVAIQSNDLSNRLSKLSKWSTTPSKLGIERRLVFPSFATAWRFMCVVADECKAKRHHPTWTNVYNKVHVEWTTHEPKGLTIKDVEMAEFCDHIADEIGLQGHNHLRQSSGTASSDGSSLGESPSRRT